MKRPLIFLLLFLSLATFSTPTKAQTKTDTIRFTVKPSTEVGATNTLTCLFSSDIRNNIRVEWVSGGNKEELTLTDNETYFNTTLSITAAGRVYIYYHRNYNGVTEYGYGCAVGKNTVGAISFINATTNDLIVDSLDVSGCTAMGSLICGNNKLTALNVNGCTSMVTLWCQDNRLTTLDVSTNTVLQTLICSNNQLTALDVSANTGLGYFECNDNQLTALAVSDYYALRLYCNNNHIPLSTLNDIYTQKTSWPAFEAKNQTDTISLAACQALDLFSEKEFGGTATTFWLRNASNQNVSSYAYIENNFSFLFKDPFNGTLTLQNSQVPTSSMTYHITAEECVLPTDTIRFTVEKQTGSSEIVYNFSDKVKTSIKIEWIPSDGGASTRFTPDKNGRYTQTISENGQVRIYYTHAPDADPYYSLGVKNGNSNKDISVNLLRNHVASLDVSRCTALTDLDCEGNQQTILDVSGCTALDTLNCNSNQLSSLDVRECTALTVLNCGLNQLTDLDVSANTDLKYLKCIDNRLTTLDVSANIALTDFDCYNNQLSSLDVSGCTALMSLRCHNNKLTTLDVSKNTDLTYLQCNNNQLKTLDVSHNVALTNLRCNDNQLTALDVSKNTDLTELMCHNNQLAALNVSTNTALKTLWCGNNKLTALSINTAMEYLSCANNSLPSLDVSGCTALETLSCYNNQLTTLDVSGNTALTSFTFNGNNQLTDLNASGCVSLASLDCANYQLANLNVSGCTSLTSLNCSNNQLTTLDVSTNTDLTQLYCENNQLTTLNLSNNASLSYLTCGQNHIPLSTIYGIYSQRENSNWDWFNADPQTDTISLSACEPLDLATQSPLGGTETTFTLNPNIASTAYTEDDFSFVFNEAFAGTLELQNKSVPDVITMTYHITAEECASEPPTPSTTKTDTIRLDVEKTGNNSIHYKFSDIVKAGIEIEWISEDGTSTRYTPDQNGFTRDNGRYTQTISGNGQVRIYYTHASDADSYSLGVRRNSNSNEDISVNFSGNSVTSLNVSGCTALAYLDCNINALTSLDVSSCTALETLNCSDNQLTSLDVRGCTALTTFWCNNNQLTDLNVSGCAALTTLRCYANQLLSLDVSQNTALISLYCSENQLTALDVSQNTALISLYCSENQLTALDVSQNTAVTYLNCSANQLTSLDVSHNTILQELNCSNNQLTALDVSACTDLETLGCYNNQLTALNVGHNPDWEYLYCSNNHLSLSTLYDIYSQRANNWEDFDATDQTDTVSVVMCRALNLSSEKTLGDSITTYVLKDEEGNEVPASAYTEDDFSFTFKDPFTGTLKLQNKDFTNIWMGYDNGIITMTYHITMVECLSVSVSANNGAWGWATQTGNGTYEKDSLVTIIATPAEGYRFVNWTKEGEVFSINAVYTFAVTENLTLVANFEEIPEEPVVEETFTVGVYSINEAWGSVSQSGNGTYKKDSLASITATAAEGYRFVNWVRAGLPEAFCTRTDTTFAVTENLVLIASFEKIPDEPLPPVEEGFTITLTPNNPAWGMVFKTGNCVYGEGEEIKILALPYAGYRFVNWTKPDGSVFGTDSLITFKVTESLELTANFEKIPDGPVVKNDLRLDSIPVGMVAPPLLPNNGLPGFPVNGYPFENEEMIYTAVFHGDSAVLRLCAGNEVRIALATSGGEGALTYTWTADGGVSVYEENVALDAWPYVTHDSVLVVFFPDSGTHLLNCRITDASGAALDAKVHVSYHTPELLYIEALPKTTTAKYYEGQAVCFQARPQRYADYAWFRVRDRESYAEITDRQLTQEALYHASFKLERPEERHQVWVSVVDRYGCRLWDSAGVELMMMPNVMVLNDPNRPMDGVIFPEFEVEITNVWGMCVKGFSDRNGNGSSRGWDGCTPSGTKVTAGTYYYRVKIPTLDGFVYMPGAVTVINK